jgi:hypothetical protein
MPKDRKQSSRPRGAPAKTNSSRATESSKATAPIPSTSEAHTHTGRSRAEGSFEARFGRVILQHGIAAIPAGLLHYQGKLGLDAKHLWFVEYILSCKWDANLPYPSLNRMERCTGVDIQALYRYKKALCEQGYLKVYKRLTKQGGYDTNAYDFSPLFERLERLIAAEAPAHNPISAEPADRGPEPATIDSSFVARYGRIIVRYGVAAVPRAIFTHQGALSLTPQQVWFISYIFSFKWDTALPYPSIERMAANTGYSRAYLHEIKASLVNAGYLRLVHRVNEQGGQDSNAYDFSSLLDAIRDQLQVEEDQLNPSYETPITTPEVIAEPQARRRSRLAAQARATHMSTTEGNGRVGDSIIRHKELGINRQIGVGINEQIEVPIIQHTEIGINKQIVPGLVEVTPPVYPQAPAHVAQRRRGKVAPSIHEIETINTEANNRDDSNQIPQKKRSRDENVSATTTSPPYSHYIAGVIIDFSNELNDPDHGSSNVTQALRLWQQSGHEENQFIELVYEAKQRTRKYQGKSGLRGIENKMAYFFAVLKDLCGLQSSQSDPSRQNSEQIAGEIDKEVRMTTEESRRAYSTVSDLDKLKELHEKRGTEITMSARQVWQAALGELQNSVSSSDFGTWLRTTSIVGFDSNTAVIAAPSNFAKDWLEKRFRKPISEALSNVLGHNVQVRFEVRTPS